MRPRKRRLVVLLFASSFFPISAQIDSLRKTDTVRVTVEQDALRFEGKRGMKSEILNANEFKKAACCTLSESFESTNSVEVSSSDAVSGVKKVEMLGLPGKYVNMTRSQLNMVQGVNVITGFGSVPGPMVSNVNISKGVGSVTNGYRGITGGIDYSLKLEDAPKLFANAYVNNKQRNEQNLIFSVRPTAGFKNVSYLHRMGMNHATDNNSDGFTDMPLSESYMLGNSTRFQKGNIEGMFGVQYTQNKAESGQKVINENLQNPYWFTNDYNDFQAFAKLGILLKRGNSIGNIFQFQKQGRNINILGLDSLNSGGTGPKNNMNSQQSTARYTGMLDYKVSRKVSTKSGIDLSHDQMDEVKYGRTLEYQNFLTENSAGLFSEWFFESEKLDVLMGLRADISSLYGVFLTPRLHAKYQINPNQKINFLAGVGRRRPNVLSDNFFYFLGQRKFFMFDNIRLSNPVINQALTQEIGYNTGIGYTLDFKMFKRKSTISFDGFFTYFKNQWIIDRDANSSSVIVSPQSGAYSTAAQIDWVVTPRRRLDYHFSYRYVNAMMKTGGQWQQQFLQSPHRIVQVLSYQTRNKWSFNGIWQTNGPARYPNTSGLNDVNRLPERTPWLNMANFLLQKTIKTWEIYGGVENILNVRQANIIMSSQDVSQPYFDPAYAWGPANGRTFFVGFRYTLK